MSRILVAFACAALAAASAAAQTTTPTARREVVSEIMHGVRIDDPYRWLEAVDSNEAQVWATGQNAATEAYAGPGVSAREARILNLSRGVATRQMTEARFGTLTLRGWAGVPRQSLFLDTGVGEPRLIDGAALDAEGSDQSVSSYWVSPDGTLVLSFSTRRGSNWGELRLIDIASGSELMQRSDVQSAVTSAAWLADGRSFAYTAYERDGDAPVRGRILVVTLDGVQSEVFAPTVAPGRVLTVSAGPRRQRLFVEAVAGSTGESDLYVVDLNRTPSPPRMLTNGGGLWTFLGARADRAWVFTNAGSPNGRVVRFDALSGRPTQRTVIPEGRGTISGASQVGGNAMAMVGQRIALLFQEDAVPSIRVFDLGGRERFRVETPPTGAVWGGFFGTSGERGLHYGFLGGGEPSSIYRIDFRTSANTLVTAAETGIAPNDIVAHRVFVERPGGVRVPVIVAHRRGLDLSHPQRTMMYAYGAFAWVSFLWYQPQVLDWMFEDDGVFVVAGVRGGGEFGGAWHEAGRRRNRQTAIDDYIAVAEHLVTSGVTRADLLVANGGSISGALAAGAANQRPDLFGAAVIDFGVLDLLRYDRFGHAGLWRDELGSPADADDFRVLGAISPYHNIPHGACPPTIIRVGLNDATVTPAHGYKYAAALQAACSGPVFLDVMEGAGHDYGATPAQVARSHAVALELLRRVLPAN